MQITSNIAFNQCDLCIALSSHKFKIQNCSLLRPRTVNTTCACVTNTIFFPKMIRRKFFFFHFHINEKKNDSNKPSFSLYS